MNRQHVRQARARARIVRDAQLVQLAVEGKVEMLTKPMALTLLGRIGTPQSPMPPELTVPAGIANFSLTFAKGAEVLFQSTRALILGFANVPPDTTGPRIPDGIEEGFSTASYSGTAPEPGNYYYLWDRWGSIEREGDGNSTRPTGGELVYVTAADTVNHTVTFRDPVSRPYPAFEDNVTDTLLSTVPKDQTCRNITLRGLRMSGDRTTSHAAIECGYVDGLTLLDCHVEKSKETGIQVKYSRDVLVQGCSGSELGDQGERGYAIQIERCTDVLVKDCWAHDARYAVQIEAGCSNFTVDGAAGTDIQVATFDIHGGGSYTGTVREVAAHNDGIQIGNSTWRKGCIYVTVENCTFKKLTIQGSVDQFIIQNCAFDYAELTAYKSTVSPFPIFFPGYIGVYGCVVNGASGHASVQFVNSSWNQVEYLDFLGSSITANSGYRVLDMPARDASTNIAFVDSTAYGGGTTTPLHATDSYVTVRSESSSFHIPANSGGTHYYIADGSGTFFNNTHGGLTPSHRVPSGQAIVAADVSSTYTND